MRISSSTMAVTGCTNAATGTPVPGTTARGGWYRRWRCRYLFCVFPYAITVLPLPISTGGVQMARRTGDTTGGMNGSSGEADGTAGTAESCRSLPRYRSISDTIQGTVIRKECSRSRYIARIIAINPATLKSGSIDQTTHSKRILHHGVVVSRKRPSNEGKGRVMASAPSSPHLRRVLPSAGILSSHSGQGKMGAAQILRRCRPSSGSGRVRCPFRRRSHSRGKNGRNSQGRGAIRTSFSKVADHRRIRGGRGRDATVDKHMGRNATGRENRHRSRDLSLGFQGRSPA
jgi:hypothetical protein